jgi:disulfide bond formation protein DsbB
VPSPAAASLVPPGSPTRWLALLAFAAAAALVGALAMQHLGGLEPCQLCIYERYPYLVAVVAAVLGAWLGRPRLALGVVALALAANVGLAAYHVGVEQGWFALPESCAAVGEAATVEDLKAQLLNAPARCDQVPLTVLGLSLAAWNGVYAAGLLALAVLALLRRSPASGAQQDRYPRVA